MRIVAVATLLVLALLATVAPEPTADAAPAVAAPAAASTWRPVAGPAFNDPTGNKAARMRIISRVHAAIINTPPGGVIRIATYNIGLQLSANHLLRAHKRGVRVQIVVNSNLVGALEARMQRQLGKNPGAPSFLVVCRNACRNSSASGNMHLKVYSFSRTGAVSNVVISSSSNLGGPAAHRQWNDSYTVVGDKPLFDAWAALFAQLRRDRPVSPRRVVYRSETLQAAFQRQLVRAKAATSTSGDAVASRLQAIGCTAPAGYGDAAGRTLVTVNMYAWYGARGERLARLLAARKKQGCVVRVIGSLTSKPVVKILQQAKIPFRAADWHWGPRPSTSDRNKIIHGPRCYSHLKYATVNGAYQGKGTRLVWTGSENWSAPALSSDEVTFQIHDPQVYLTYNRHWMSMWNSSKATHQANAQPTKRPCA